MDEIQIVMNSHEVSLHASRNGYDIIIIITMMMWMWKKTYANPLLMAR